MKEYQQRHLVLVRHGESEGDVRRQKKLPAIDQHPKDERETNNGHQQSRASGAWIAKYILNTYGFESFNNYITSPLIRAKDSARSLGLSDFWTEDLRITERNRGDLQGITKQQHQEKYPTCYRQMIEHPFHWNPPNGESLLKVASRLSEFIDDFLSSSSTSTILMTHRDVMWAGHISLDKLPLAKVEAINTDSIKNSCIFHYTNVNPNSGKAEQPELTWKRIKIPFFEKNTPNDYWIKLS